MQALELLLDDETDEAVRREWTTLRRAGLPSQADHTGASNAPHVTMLATNQLAATDDELGAAVAGAFPLTLHLGSVVAFPGRRLVLARLVVADAALLELHAALVAAARATPSPHTTTGRWVPHVTLARGIPMDELGAALSLMRAPGYDGTATRLRRWDGVEKQTHPVSG
jgi:2'-5' RNA ligase